MWSLSMPSQIEMERNILQIEDFKCKIWIATHFSSSFSKLQVFKYKIFPDEQKKWCFFCRGEMQVSSETINTDISISLKPH